MAVRSDQGQTWDDVELPCVLRYRKNAFVVHFIVAAALFLAAGLCVALFGRLVAGLPLTVAGGMSIVLTIVPLRHVRTIDHLRVDTDALTLVARDGTINRIAFEPGIEFSVTYEQCCRSIVMTSTRGDPWDGEHVIADMLDVPRGQTIYGLCQLMNDLSRGYARTGMAGPRPGASTIQRRQDWYREPPRISRAAFLAGTLGLFALFACVQFFLTLATWSLSGLVAKPILFAAKLGLGLLFIYPALRFLVVARLRDLGESATHRNAAGLLWNSSAGWPLRLFLRRGQVGRNQFGPEPRF